jgi:hypothetical protein
MEKRSSGERWLVVTDLASEASPNGLKVRQMNTPNQQGNPAFNSSSVFSVARMLREEADLLDEQPSVEVRLTLYDVERLLVWAEALESTTDEELQDYHATLRDILLEAQKFLQADINPEEDI